MRLQNTECLYFGKPLDVSCNPTSFNGINMQSTHFVFDREDLEDLPDYSHLDKYRRLLLELPDEDINNIRKHLDNAYLEFYCKCGCHSFLVYPKNPAELPTLQETEGIYREIAYQTNYDEELNVMLFVDTAGILSQVTIFFRVGNTRAIPNDLEVTGIEGIWKSGLPDEPHFPKIGSI